MLDVNKILEKWISFTNFDENQTHFNLLSWNYEFHKRNKMIMDLTKKYSIPEEFVLKFIKVIFESYLKENKISFFDFFKKGEEWIQERELYDMFYSDDFIQYEKDLYSSFNKIAISILGNKLIGEINYEEIADDLMLNLFEEFSKLNQEIYLKSENPVANELPFFKEIKIFNTLAECLVSLEQGPDGIRLCYIAQYMSDDGYFAFFIKSNGNIFSINERIEEAFIGQHKNGRNHRFSEKKKYNLFPYELFDFGQYDYLGYSTCHKIEQECLSYDKLSTTVLLNMIISIYLIIENFKGRNIDGEIIYSHHFVKPNVDLQLENKNNALMNINKSIITINNQEALSFDFSTDDILNNTKAAELDYNSKKETGRNYRECGYFINTSNIFVELYGDGFVLDKNKVFFDDTLKLLNAADTKELPNTEFIGNKKVMELQYYARCREQLADYIKENMKKEFENFKKEYVSAKQWYENILESKKDMIIKKIVSLYVEKNNSNDETHDHNKPPVRYSENLDWISTKLLNPTRRKNNNSWSKIYVDNYNDKPCNVYITLEIRDYRQIEWLIEDDVPKIIKGYTYWNDYVGNPNLDVVDPVSRICTPFTRTGSFSYDPDAYKFDVCVGFSRSGLKKYMKDNGLKLEEKTKG